MENKAISDLFDEFQKMLSQNIGRFRVFRHVCIVIRPVYIYREKLSQRVVKTQENNEKTSTIRRWLVLVFSPHTTW